MFTKLSLQEYYRSVESMPVWHVQSMINFIDIACVHGSTNGNNGIPISFKVLPLVPLIPLVKTDGSQYYRQSTVWAKLPTLESHMIQYGVLNFCL